MKPKNPNQEIAGLEEALRATEKSIKEESKGPKKELEDHRQILVRQLEEARKKIRK